ncbi:hypothetical protein [Levilactobacillus bambusae]|uniref:Uncharacterized protein n=1 Tax=Levilactobacillus bambusae TaxID=2024736 RepID=A0A2V1MZ54_9LACO|nr:hypothetical protein [Levilactobacillus bambusae]PWG00294.1 hypothetical protein DCM90_05015 [Levilactobacillus bambusae]
MAKYEANIQPLNEDKIGTAPHGKATFELDEKRLRISIEMEGVPANMMHWEHFHGFVDGKDAQPATMAQDTNHDGFVDLVETEPVSGTTMVPFDSAPQQLDIANSNYPVANEHGNFDYFKEVGIDELVRNFKKAFNDANLDLDKRVVYIHGVPDDMQLPDTVQGMAGEYDQHVTLPIACGKIVKVSD